MWARVPRYRLMALAVSGDVYLKAWGSLLYLRRIGAKARAGRGRQWIDLSLSPATARRPRPPRPTGD